jgi:SET domain-containing protein
MGAVHLTIPPAITSACNAARFQIRETRHGRGLFACEPIARGTPLFGEDDWVDEAEARSFSVLSPDQIEGLSLAERKAFLCYAYNTAPEEITGTFEPEAVRHPVNFINHSCEPNLGYDGVDAIVALRDMAVGEEIRMDYGTYSFSFDHQFSCSCGAWACRSQVRREDWRTLVRTGLRLPGFMRAHADQALWG